MVRGGTKALEVWQENLCTYIFGYLKATLNQVATSGVEIKATAEE